MNKPAARPLAQAAFSRAAEGEVCSLLRLKKGSIKRTFRSRKSIALHSIAAASVKVTGSSLRSRFFSDIRQLRGTSVKRSLTVQLGPTIRSVTDAAALP